MCTLAPTTVHSFLNLLCFLPIQTLLLFPSFLPKSFCLVSGFLFKAFVLLLKFACCDELYYHLYVYALKFTSLIQTSYLPSGLTSPYTLKIWLFHFIFSNLNIWSETHNIHIYFLVSTFSQSPNLPLAPFNKPRVDRSVLLSFDE